MKLNVVVDSSFAHFVRSERLLGELVLLSDDWRINQKRFNVQILSMPDSFESQDKLVKYYEGEIVECAITEKRLLDEIHHLRKSDSTTSRLLGCCKRAGGVDNLDKIVSEWESSQKKISESNEVKTSDTNVLINQLVDHVVKKGK